MSDAYRAQSKNIILVKDEVGRAKKSVYDLPHEAHAYGRSEIPDLEGAREVTMNWAPHVPNPRSEPACQDFRKLNKMAAKSAVSNAKQLAEFRRGTDVRMVNPGPVGCLPKVIPSDVIPSFAYGRKSRPSTPIYSVVGGHYAVESEQEANAIYSQYEAENSTGGKQRIKLTKAASSRISNARSRRANPETEEKAVPWTMSKFKKIGPRMTSTGELLPATNLSRSRSLPNIASTA